MKELIKAIVAKTSGTALETAVNGRIYFAKVPRGVIYPYVVFFPVTAVPDKTFTEDFTELTIQFSVFSADPMNPDECLDISALVQALFDECSLSIADSTLVYFDLNNIQGPMPDDSISPEGADGGYACHLDFDVKTSLN